jgi:hypothetical protein
MAGTILIGTPSQTDKAPIKDGNQGWAIGRLT